MATRIDVKSNGSPVLSVTGGPYYTELMSPLYERTDVYVEFYSDTAGEVPVRPTAGQVLIAGSPMGNVWLSNGDDTGVINAPDVDPTAAVAPYTPRELIGMMQQGRVTFTGIVGALTARVVFWRY